MKLSRECLVKTFITLLILMDSALYFMIQQQSGCRSQACWMPCPRPVEDLPVFRYSRNKQTRSYRDVFHQWGYAIENQTFMDLGKHSDPYTKRIEHGLSYRVFQNQSSDKIYDYIPRLNEFVTIKANLVRLGGKYIPKGFLLPKQLERFLRYRYSSQKKGNYWIQKDAVQRGCSIKRVDDLDLTKPSLIQEYIGNPFIIDGRKFSIGVYVAFSSGNPFRAYVLDSTIFLRYAEKEYYPENIDDPSTYITDAHDIYDTKAQHEVEPIKTYREKYQYTFRKGFDAHMRSVGKNPTDVYTQIDDAIRDILNKYAYQVEESSDPESKWMQLTRWDFILDSNMSVYLIEANGRPGLYPGPLRTKDDCEHVIYNSFPVMGFKYPFKWKQSGAFYIRDPDVLVANRLCYTTFCSSCQKTECFLCSHCLTQYQVWVFKQMLQEHIQRGTTRLIYPYNTPEDSNQDNGTTVRLWDDGYLPAGWLKAKCKQDQSWCFH